MKNFPGDKELKKCYTHMGKVPKPHEFGQIICNIGYVSTKADERADGNCGGLSTILLVAIFMSACIFCQFLTE